MARHTRTHIYASPLHVGVTLVFVLLPFLYFVLFTNAAHLSGKTLALDIVISLLRILIAYCIAAVIGWTCAIAFYRGKRSLIALPLFDVLQSFPTFAALPIAVLAWGATNTTVIVFLSFAIIWPIFFSIVSSLRLIKHDWEEVATLYNLTGFSYIRSFLAPASLTGFITGSIIGLGDGWEALIATEIIVGTPFGLGTFFQTFSHNNHITLFGILGFLVIIFSINKLIWLPLLEWSHRRTEE